MYAAEIDGRGEYVIFELLDSIELEIGDLISHPDFYSMGGETFMNLTQQCQIDVFFKMCVAQAWSSLSAFFRNNL